MSILGASHRSSTVYGRSEERRSDGLPDLGFVVIAPPLRSLVLLCNGYRSDFVLGPKDISTTTRVGTERGNFVVEGVDDNSSK